MGYSMKQNIGIAFFDILSQKIPFITPNMRHFVQLTAIFQRRSMKKEAVYMVSQMAQKIARYDPSRRLQRKQSFQKLIIN